MSASIAKIKPTPPSDALYDAIDHTSVVKSIFRISGQNYSPETAFREICDIWSPERAFAIMVLAQALDDIYPSDIEPQRGLSQKQLTEWHHKQEQRRQRCISAQQFLEQESTKERRQIIAQYRAALNAARKIWGIHNPKRYKTFMSWLQDTTDGRRLRNKFSNQYNSFLANLQDIDTTNTALSWFENNRAEVEFWCHMANVNTQRCYQAVQRRLLKLDRCSIAIHNIIKELSREQNTKLKSIRTAKYEDQGWIPFTANEARVRRQKEALQLLSIVPRELTTIAKNSDRTFIENMRQIVRSENNVVGQKQLERLRKIVELLPCQ